jgi:hypothetical protein
MTLSISESIFLSLLALWGTVCMAYLLCKFVVSGLSVFIKIITTHEKKPTN